MDKNKELQEIKAKLEQSDKTFKQIRADMGEDKNNEIYWRCMDSCYAMLNDLRGYIYSVEDNFYKTMDNHTAGHLPKIQGAEKMQNALETLGLDGDYEIQKPTLYIRASRQGNKEFEVDLNIK